MKDFNLSINDRIEVIAKEKLYKSLIIDIDDDSMTINLPINEGKYLMLHQGDKIEMNCYTKDLGYFNFYANVISKAKEGNIVCYKLTEPYNEKRIQRRNFFRVDLIRSIEYKNITNVNEDEVEGIPFKNGVMVDLSGGGIKLKLKEHFEKDELLLIKMKVKKEEMILKGVIVRIEDTIDKEILCGVEFIDIAQKQCDKIIEELFEIMRKQIATS